MPQSTFCPYKIYKFHVEEDAGWTKHCMPVTRIRFGDLCFSTGLSCWQYSAVGLQSSAFLKSVCSLLRPRDRSLFQKIHESLQEDLDFEMTDVDGVITYSDFELLKSRSSVRRLFLIEPNSGSVIPAAAFCTEQ